MRSRPERIGKQLSWVRFSYIGRHLKRFQNRVIAEMLPPTIGDQGNIFWDHYGKRVTGLSFREADRLSAHDKEFIPALFPDAPPIFENCAWLTGGVNCALATRSISAIFYMRSDATSAGHRS